MPKILQDVSQAVDEILLKLGKSVKLATPLGLGKPNLILNELFERAQKDSGIDLKIYTALSLNPPRPENDLASRFLKPFSKRQWGENYPDLKYTLAAEAGKLPENVTVHEFYFRAGSSLKSKSLQRHYQSINYTRVAEAVFQENIQLILQLVAKDPKSGNYSLSCNPDVTLDLVDFFRKGGKSLLKVAMVHPDLPFMGGDAEVAPDFFDFVVENSVDKHELFALPRLPIGLADHAIGFYASQLVADDGTLQIGIGSLSDAVVSSLLLRHQNNVLYRDLAQKTPPFAFRQNLPLETSVFSKGIYGLSEMVTDAYMHLHKAGILKRVVIDEKSGTKTFLHGAFFLGSKDLYAWLRSLRGADFDGVRMTRVSKVNDLYDPHELTLRRQRINARFLNTCMQVTLLGGAASETLEDGRVVSGVGGQYNFVAMSEELKNARSILMLRSFREHEGKRQSNIVWSHGHLTIPRHLRDLVITEYGIADLRNKTDEECIKTLLEITDAEFQPALMEKAKKNGKLSDHHQVSESARQNNPESLKKWMRFGRQQGAFKTFALGSDFTAEEEKLAVALDLLKEVALQKIKPLTWIFSSLKIDSKSFAPELKRMNLESPKTLKDHLYRRLLIKALHETREAII